MAAAVITAADERRSAGAVVVGEARVQAQHLREGQTSKEIVGADQQGVDFAQRDTGIVQRNRQGFPPPSSIELHPGISPSPKVDAVADDRGSRPWKLLGHPQLLPALALPVPAAWRELATRSHIDDRQQTRSADEVVAGRRILVTGANQGIGRRGGRIWRLRLARGLRRWTSSILLGYGRRTSSSHRLRREQGGRRRDGGSEAAVEALGGIDGLVDDRPAIRGPHRPSTALTLEEHGQRVIDVNSDWQLPDAAGCAPRAHGGSCQGRHRGRARHCRTVPLMLVVAATSRPDQLRRGQGRQRSVLTRERRARTGALFGTSGSNAIGLAALSKPRLTETIRARTGSAIPISSRSRFRPLRGAGRVAKPVLFLLSDAASYVTGQTLSVNGGYVDLSA